MKAVLRSLIPSMVPGENEYREPHKTAYLGTYMALDPCGRYHSFLSPNGATKDCETFWEKLEAAAESLGGWIESGEGDPCDIFFSLPDPRHLQLVE